jgi:hypothetical protein
VSRRTVQRIEAGRWANLTFDAVRRVADALGAYLRIMISWNGEQLDRLVDAAHAELQNAFAVMLRAAGWLVAVEVSFNHYGDRGRYDILAFHPPTGIVLVVEVKTAIGDVQATLGTLDMKLRLAAIVAQRQGWPRRPAAAVPALVIADERQQHRLVAHHAALFARFVVRGRTARAWLRRPTPDPGGLLLYLPMTNARLVSVRTANRGHRVRQRPATATDAPRPVQKALVAKVSPM